ncbi:triose-phosphate isomerase [Microbulbifer discodermiae]|uniref:triose-phosphate isomerase n=1 Tax=Microbulbifer sp. 2201CG32-9 TaxID=3232309 RepID=UPI00345B5DF3
MRTPLVVANWKMNGSREFVEQFFAAFKLAAGTAQVAICPPFPYLPAAAGLSGQQGGIALGAQNLSERDQGAFTGEVAGAMLRDIGVHYVIVGHSERRSLFGETSDLVAQKFIAAQRADLIPILCVGETLEQRDSGNTFDVIRQQLQAVAGLTDASLDRAVVAYEPVWAIGTGVTATPQQAQEVHSFIRDSLGSAGQNVQVLYGGSVKSDNAEALFAQDDIDGALVGGASLDPEEFAKICRAA